MSAPTPTAARPTEERPVVNGRPRHRRRRAGARPAGDWPSAPASPAAATGRRRRAVAARRAGVPEADTRTSGRSTVAGCSGVRQSRLTTSASARYNAPVSQARRRPAPPAEPARGDSARLHPACRCRPARDDRDRRPARPGPRSPRRRRRSAARSARRETLAREVGYVRKPHGGRLRVALAFPNTYFVGMSNLGLQTVYQLFNADERVVCERVFLPAQAGARRLLGAARAARHDRVADARPRFRRLRLLRLLRMGLHQRRDDAAAGGARAARRRAGTRAIRSS